MTDNLSRRLATLAGLVLVAICLAHALFQAVILPRVFQAYHEAMVFAVRSI